MSKLLTKANFAIARLASKEEADKAHLRGIFVSPEGTKVTDGHCAFIITAADRPQLPLFDDGDGVEIAEYFTGFALDRDSALKVAKAIPKPKKDDANDKARFAIVDATSEDNSRAVISVSDLRRQEILRADKMPCEYPKIEKVFPDRKRAKLAINFNPELLAQALKAVDEFCALTGCGSVELSFYGAGNAVRIEAIGIEQSLTGVIMPQRSDQEEE